ncbi:MAG TPA: protein imuA [Caulobacteraceae bacterium]
MSREARLQAVRKKIAAIETGSCRPRAVAPFGDGRIDRLLPGGGLPLSHWHEVAGEGLEIELAAAPGAFVAALAAPLAARGVMVWVMRKGDLYAPGLAGLGLAAERLIQVEARDEAQALGALEDALGSAGVAVAVGEIGAVDLTAGRRLQLACERGGATGFVIVRRPFGGRRGLERTGLGAATRWRISPAPSQPAGGEIGLGPPRWRVTLARCRGGAGGAWTMEKSDGAYPLRVVAELGDRQLETPQPLRLAG